MHRITLIAMCLIVSPPTYVFGGSHEKEANKNRDRTYRAARARPADVGGGHPRERRSLRVGRRSPRFDNGGILEGSGPDVGNPDTEVCDDLLNASSRDCSGEGVGGS